MDIKGFDGEYRFLSNFWPCDVLYYGLIFPSSENAYQASKFNMDMWYRFVDITPAQSKKLSRLYTPREGWDDIKLVIMYHVLCCKFMQNNELACKLTATGDAYLEETNHWQDVWWGVCDGVGTNHLGHLLMKVRSELIQT